MVKLAGALSNIHKSKILVVGDLFLDTYTIGKVRRISPEAPVAVINVEQEEHRPGGAGNVALNLISLGSEVIFVGRIGDDKPGQNIIDAFTADGINTNGLFYQKNYQTPVKNRIIAENQQIVRVDHEVLSATPEQLEQEIIEALPFLMEGVELVAISDYGKGFLTPTLLNAVVDYACKKNLMVITDPKGTDFIKYSKTTLIKPNLKEAYEAANLPLSAPIELVAESVLQSTQAELLMITRSQEGISLFDRKGEHHHFPVQVREVKDVTGAGDTVLAILCCALANQLTYREAVQLCNIGAGIAIERFGCARVTLSDLARRLLEYNSGNKIFQEEHLFTLKHALKGRPFQVLGVTLNDRASPSLFSSILELSKTFKGELLVYVRDEEPDPDMINMIVLLNNVDFVIIKSDSLKHLLEEIVPERVFVLEEGSLKEYDTIESCLSP